MKYLLLLALLTSCAGTSTIQAQQADSLTLTETESCEAGCSCGGTQTPAAIMTDHIHEKGSWMANYMYMNMHMHGNQVWGSSMSNDQVFHDYMMAPQDMTMQMHMVMLMYGATDRLTLMATGGYATSSMSMVMSDNMMSMPGMNMTTGDMMMYSQSSGFTDTRISALYRISRRQDRRLIGSIGVSLPTGSIHAAGVTILGENQRLPYAMQPGSGSVGIQPGITYIWQHNSLSVGGDLGADIKLNNNSLGYRLGNVYHLSAWSAYRLLPFLSASLRAEMITTGNIHGSDALMDIDVYQQNDPMTVTGNYGGTATHAYAGLNLHIPGGLLDHFNLMGEYGRPIYQYAYGLQMTQKGYLVTSLQYLF